MTSNEYIETITLMMEKQDMYLMWFLGVLGIVLVFVGVLQWRLSSKQIEKLKIDIKNESREEIMNELIGEYEINKIPKLKVIVKKLDKKTSNISKNQKIAFDTSVVTLFSDIKSGSVDEVDKKLFYFITTNFELFLQNKEYFEKFWEYFNEFRIMLHVDMENDFWKLCLFNINEIKEKHKDAISFDLFFKED